MSHDGHVVQALAEAEASGDMNKILKATNAVEKAQVSRTRDECSQTRSIDVFVCMHESSNLLL